MPNAQRAISPAYRLFALSFTALFLELMLIRWTPAVVRLVAYYANLMLISSFLGLGIGAMLASRRRDLFAWFPILLGVDVALLWASSGYLVAPTASGEARFYQTPGTLLGQYAVLVFVFALNVALFVPLGQRIARLFTEMPPLRAYTWDLGGSLCGTLFFGAFSLLHFSPLLGFALVMTAFAIVAGGGRARTLALVAMPIVLAGVFFTTSSLAVWSPYYYITVFDNATGAAVDPATAPPGLRSMVDPPTFVVHVGQDFYQADGTIDPSRYRSDGPLADDARKRRDQYFLPYQLTTRRDRVAVMGAGGGQDVEAALLNGAKHVDAVEIDPALVELSRKLSAADPYGDPRVTVHVNDARAHLRTMPSNYDLIVFGFLDSQALFSTMSNLRLDGYIYTVESMRSAYERLADGGVMTVSFAVPVEWMADKLAAMLRDATGVEPMHYRAGQSDGALALCVVKGTPTMTAPSNVGIWTRRAASASNISRPTDDWPYLYLSQRTIPRDYVVVIVALLIASTIAVVVVRGTRFSAGDGHFFSMGLGFLLLQTKSITDCSLYFGATWLVTTIVIAGVLIMVLAANFVAIRVHRSPKWLYAPLLASLLLLQFVSRDAILAQPFATRLAWSMLIVPLPIFFAGVIFSSTFRDADAPALALGANLIGATVGGFCEYLGMATGTHALGWIVIAAYLVSLAFRLRFETRRANGSPSSAPA